VSEITFTRTEDGIKQGGSINTDYWRFQWLRDDGSWDGGWAVEPITDLLARMNLGGPYKYSAYRILEAETPALVIKPTCHGCGMIAGISCQMEDTHVFTDYEFTEHSNLLVDYDDNHQFALSLPVVTEGRNYGKARAKQVTFNSVRCANLTLMQLARRERNEIVSYPKTQTLGEYRAAQGYKRCPQCKAINKGEQFCSRICEEKYTANLELIQDVAPVIETVKPARTYRCGNPCCGTGRDDKGNRVRGKVPKRGEFCSKDCRRMVKEAAKQRLAHPPIPETGLIDALTV